MSAWQAEPAPAKINLALHVTGRAADGRHFLSSLVAFTTAGDRLRARSAPTVRLDLTGPFAQALTPEADNLVLRAARAFGSDQGALIELDKCLPVASGIGGGSADAAAALRLLSRLWELPVPDALPLGADLPVCLALRPALMEGIGERLTPLDALPPCAVLLVNPGQPVATGAVFAALEQTDNAALPPLPRHWPNAAALAAWLMHTRNDLEAPASRIAPVIEEVLTAVAAMPGCMIARMSGSGATCFGLFQTDHACADAAQTLARQRPQWWICPTELMPAG